MPGLTLSPRVSVQPVLVSAGEASVRGGVVDGVIHPRLTCVGSHVVIDTLKEYGAGFELKYTQTSITTSKAYIRLRYFVFAPYYVILSNI